MRRLARVLSGLLLALAAAAASADASGVLPRTAVPVEYALHLVPDLPARTFSGRMSVAIDVRRPTATLLLHALDLEIEPARLRRPGGATETIAPVLDAARQTVAFTPARPLAPGRHTLALAWRGRINAAVEGLYADRYRDADGAERTLLATDLEPTGARRILPCWDEPSFRARFRLSVDLPAGDAAISNMPIARSERVGARRRIAFATTPKMASYLLVLVAGDLERASTSVDGTELGVVATRGKLGRTAYPLAASGTLLRWFNDYFAIRYPLPKLDQIAVPGGFVGGMENWGGIVYNEASLLIDPDAATEAGRQRSFGLLAHEIAHQWFGNLVTMAWWDDLWLNEAFASWVGYKATEDLHPQWHTWRRAKAAREKAMALDARDTTHPIRQPVERDSEAADAFDEITYDKGSAFLRMLEAWLGEAPFRAGVRAYLARHRYANTTGADLWSALGRAAGRPVAALAGEWTTRPGFPLIDVDARCDAGRRSVVLRQRRFRAAPSAEATSAGDERPWPVPVTLGTADAAATTTVLLREASTTARLDDGCRGALLVDRDDVGFFRVRYAPALFDALRAGWAELPESARLKILADSAALAQADALPVARLLELLDGAPAETGLAIWEQVLRVLEAFEALGAGAPAEADVRRLARALIAPRFAALGWEARPGEAGDATLLRGRLAAALARYGDEAAIAEGRRRFARYLSAPASVDPALVEAVFDIAGRHADAATYDALLALARSGATSEERFRAYRALARAVDPELAARSVALAIDGEVPPIIRHEVLGLVAGAGHRPMAWRYAEDHAAALLADLTQYESGAFFAGIVDGSADAADADALEAFARERLRADALAEVRRGADQIRSRAMQRARLLPDLAAALAAR